MLTVDLVPVPEGRGRVEVQLPDEVPLGVHPVVVQLGELGGRGARLLVLGLLLVRHDLCLCLGSALARGYN